LLRLVAIQSFSEFENHQFIMLAPHPVRQSRLFATLPAAVYERLLSGKRAIDYQFS
jgi:hypothetical protein